MVSLKEWTSQTALILISPFVATLVGCTSDTTPATGFTVRDSAGIRIIDNAMPVELETLGWTMDSASMLEIGADSSDPRQQLLGVGDVHRLEGGATVVANSGVDHVLMFDSLGRVARIIGRRGEGPGEFRRITGLHRCGGDTLVVNDLDRVHYFDGHGEFVRSARIIPDIGDGVLRVRAVANDCSSFLLLSRPHSILSPGVVGRIPYTLLWGTLDGAIRDTIATFPAREVIYDVISGMRQPVSLPWGSDAAWAAGGGRVYLGSTERPEIRVFNQTGDLIEIIRWAAERRPVTEADRRQYRERRQRWLRQFLQLRDIIRELEDFPKIPEGKPLFLSMFVDDEGNLWVRGYSDAMAGRPDLYDFGLPLWERPVPDAAPESWTIFDRTGRMLGVMRIPPDLDIRGVQDDHVIAVWKDMDDVEHVRLYRLRRPGTAEPIQPGG